ncbi:TPA: type IVB secretion system protein IcmX [Legionella anisa]
MKLASKFMLLNVLYFTAFSATAQDTTSSTTTSTDQSQYYQNQQTEQMKKLVTYFENFGQYLGFQIKKAPTEDNKDFTVTYQLINLTTSQLSQAYQFYTLLGSIPVNTFAGQGQQSGGGGTTTGNPFAQFLPTDSANTSQYNPSATIINPLANLAFPGYASGPSAGSTGVTVNPLIDQQTFQQDPVSQAVLNILATPDYTYCMNPTSSTPEFVNDCKLIYNTLVPLNIVGEIPNAITFFDPSYLQQFLNHLNSNALTAPLMYSTQDLGTGQQKGDIAKNGLPAQNQEQLAANFIRYVSGSVIPIRLPQWSDYDYWYKQTLSSSTNQSTLTTKQMQAQQTLAKYLASLRTYAAQNSVGLSNLYFIMSKRMPQTNPNPGSGQTASGPTSQALTEFNMATWRLYNTTSSGDTSSNTGASTGTGGTGQPGNTPWINSLNNAPPATVEKEIAILLAEINYQLYLDRQVHERLLMTNSILLLQSVRTGAPSNEALSPGAQTQQ